jgi:light-regulated signal transduction histidine kinase (bacteriophytochrome)
MSVADRGLSRAVTSGMAATSDIAIQPFAALLAVTSDWVITHISENIGAFLDIDASVLGHTLDSVLLDDAVHDIRGVLHATAGQNGMGRLLGCDLRHGYPQFDLTVHDVDRGYIIEIEPSEPLSRIDDIGLIRGLIERVRQGESLEDVSARAARSLRALTGFDRVLICQVDDSGRSTPVGEARMPGTGALPAREITAGDVLNHTRHPLNSQLSMTADVEAQSVKVLSRPDALPLDLTHAISEEATAACRNFLRASGGKSSFAVAIVHGGTLVGLIICHHPKPLRTGFRTRMLVGLFADLFTYEFVATLPKTP